MFFKEDSSAVRVNDVIGDVVTGVCTVYIDAFLGTGGCYFVFSYGVVGAVYAYSISVSYVVDNISGNLVVGAVYADCIYSVCHVDGVVVFCGVRSACLNGVSCCVLTVDGVFGYGTVGAEVDTTVSCTYGVSCYDVASAGYFSTHFSAQIGRDATVGSGDGVVTDGIVKAHYLYCIAP